MRSETDLVRFLQRRFPAGGGVRVGIGDDAAVLRGSPGCDWVVTSDLLVENVHFLRPAQPARAVGWKALARSLSDIAAMAAHPRYALVALAVPAATPASWVKEFFAGVAALARRHRVQVVGGDFSSAAQVVAEVQVMGEVQRGRALLRSGARPGQAIFVSGRLGTSALGALCVRARLGSKALPVRRALRAHFYPQPRLKLAEALARRGASALIDLSDGLSTDLHHLCEASGVGARLYVERIPTVKLPGPLARRLRTNALELALHGGEDYELLFTLPATKAARLPRSLAGVPLTRIGETTKERGVVLVEHGRRRRLEARGWDHFRRRA